MKKTALIIIILFSFISCSNNNEELVDNTDLIGKWNWTSTNGGIFGHINETPTPLSKTIQIVFSKDYKFSILENGKETSKGNYTLESTEKSGERKISYTGNYKKTQGVVLNGIYYFYGNQELIISDGFADGIGSNFEKIE